LVIPKGPRLKKDSPSFTAACSLRAATPEQHHPDQETQVVELPDIVDFVHGHLIIEKAYDEGEQGDEPMPEAVPEVSGSGIEFRISRGTRGQEQQHQDEEITRFQVNSFHGRSILNEDGSNISISEILLTV
jgi:hypothetical protein